MEYLIGLIVALFGIVGYLFTKKNSAEALLQNSDLNKLLNAQDKQIAEKEALNQIEEEKRKTIADQLQKDKGKNESLDQLNNFFNSDK